MNKLAFALTLALLVPASAALADTNVGATVGVTLHGDAGQEDGQGSAAVSASSSVTSHSDEGQNDDQISGSQSQKNDQEGVTNEDNASSSESDHGSSLSFEHRSAVSAFVHSLLEDANRDGGIGEDVRAVALEQDDSASTTADAIAHVESRGKFWSFLFGTDWKNIGTLRSEIARTDNNIARLNAVIASTTNPSVKADLEAQLTALTAEQAKVKTFVDTNENSFSLFGWFTKLFAGSSTSATTTASTSAQ